MTEDERMHAASCKVAELMLGALSGAHSGDATSTARKIAATAFVELDELARMARDYVVTPGAEYKHRLMDAVERHILPEPKLDPLMKVARNFGAFKDDEWSAKLRAELDAAGLAIVEKSA